MSELCSNVSRSNNGYALRQLFHLEDRVAGVIADFVEAFDGWNDRLGANAEEDHLRLDLGALDSHNVWCDEFGGFVIIVDILGAG